MDEGGRFLRTAERSEPPKFCSTSCSGAFVRGNLAEFLLSGPQRARSIFTGLTFNKNLHSSCFEYLLFLIKVDTPIQGQKQASK
jgi:hypothetical protein